MRWTPGGRSTNLEDRRGMRLGTAVPIGGGALLLLVVLSLMTGQDLLTPATEQGPVAPSSDTGESVPVDASPEEERQVQFVSFVLDDAQDTWRRLLPGQYRDAKLVLFRDVVQSACGMAQSAAGPFYCPADEKVYIDLSFFDELRRRFGAPGDFAQVYVLAHELGHHVQNLLGIERRVRQMQQVRPGATSSLSVRMELQADCLAGVYGHSTARRDLLEPGDIEEGLNAAAAVGDDRIQRSGGGSVHPESFTHGSSAQRVEWFRRGFDSGRIEACDTFGGS